MAKTVYADVIKPEVMRPIVEAEFLYNIKVSKFAKIYNDLKGKPGDQNTFPYWSTVLNDAVDLAETDEIAPQKLAQSSWQFPVIKEVGVGTEVTDKAILSGLGSWRTEAGRQLGLSIARKVDKDVIAEANTTTTVIDITAEPTNNKMSYEVVVDALAKFGEYLDEAEALLIHSHHLTQLLKDPNFVDLTKYGQNVMVKGYKAIGMIAGVPVIISDTLPVDDGNGYYTAFLFAKEPVGIAYKRDIMIESDRDILNRTTVITATMHYAVKLLPDLRGLPKVVKIITK